ncbi:MAG: Ribosomal subunit interface protein [Actinomycetota bacterium]|nr:Ribosomal subunit interface protein [Actinomycetota bacterium]
MPMMILVTTDETIDHPEEISHRMDAECRSVLAPFQERIDRVEIRLVAGTGPTPDAIEWRCDIRASAKGRSPLGATHKSRAVHEAYEGATEQLRALLEGIDLSQTRTERSSTEKTPAGA